MSKELVVKDDIQSMMSDISNTQKVCQMLMQTPHYKKLGSEGIFAIVQKAASLGLNPLEALNGGMYFVQGKVELSAILMAKLIRQQKHSITMDKNSNETVCILHGKRADNGDTWKASFSITDAKRAGIYKDGGPWSKYPDVMCYNRALSKLARQLFPDVIGNCYVEGEISDAPPLFDESSRVNEVVATVDQAKQTISKEQAEELDAMLGHDEEYRDTVMTFLKKKFNVSSVYEMPVDLYPKVFARVNENHQKRVSIEFNSHYGEMDQMQAMEV